jgi:hypothetical protein
MSSYLEIEKCFFYGKKSVSHIAQTEEILVFSSSFWSGNIGLKNRLLGLGEDVASICNIITYVIRQTFAQRIK